MLATGVVSSVIGLELLASGRAPAARRYRQN